VRMARVMGDLRTLKSFIRELYRLINHFEQQLQRWGQQALDTIQHAGLAIVDFSYGTAGAAGYLAGLATQRRWKPTPRALHALNSVEAWYSKASNKQELIVQMVQDVLKPCLQKVIHFYIAHHHAYYTALEVRHFIYSAGLITQLCTALDEYRTTHHVMLIADITWLLRQIIAENETPFVYEKVGSFYNHFLIDEFQDITLSMA